jgi:hypothetical protein
MPVLAAWVQPGDIPGCAAGPSLRLPSFLFAAGTTGATSPLIIGACAPAGSVVR